jgi:hypothetical protein
MGNQDRNILLTPEIRYLEFNKIENFQKVLKEIKNGNYHILYSGIHRLEAGKWIIVIKEK